MFTFAPDDAIYQPLLTISAREQAYIEQVMADTQGDKVLAAQILGVNLSTVYLKLERDRVMARTRAEGGS